MKINHFYYKGKLYFKIQKNSPIRILTKNEDFNFYDVYNVYDTKKKVICFSGTWKDLQDTYPVIFKDKGKIGFDAQLILSKNYKGTINDFKKHLI